VKGESMEAEFHEADIIVINPYLRPEHNDYVVVSNEEGKATFEQLKNYGRTRVLHPLNPKYDDIQVKCLKFKVPKVPKIRGTKMAVFK